ncbi:hypothetical protein FVE67_03925 [Thermosulfurimonas marina]|uniref:Cyclophilin TM1367-like domain-containing protein n=1 Tax=Thermosulfurimonas marina TaxID=2047767 RepID=A0A6H1WS00_9BACT|nr:cyclophilin-like fold protein [Thermosulfurimonas marina]QJA05995.1 hypothetical protein FVE67_03925 [Thermosulfurimonas marina]
MPYPIWIEIGGLKLKAELAETECARRIYEALPLEAEVQEWGDEFYFRVPVECEPDETYTLKVRAGDLGYWPPGRALALFFGPTPASTGPDPVPASEVNLVGRLLDDPSRLREVKGTSRIRLEKR